MHPPLLCSDQATLLIGTCEAHQQRAKAAHVRYSSGARLLAYTGHRLHKDDGTPLPRWMNVDARASGHEIEVPLQNVVEGHEEKVGGVVHSVFVGAPAVMRAYANLKGDKRETNAVRMGGTNEWGTSVIVAGVLDFFCSFAQKQI